MKQYELTTLWSLPKQCWLVSRSERERFGKLIREWRKENPKPTIIQQMLIESLLRLHIWEQRLVDRRTLFNGEKCDYQQVGTHDVDIDSEDLAAKQCEFDKMMPQIMRWKSDLLKIAMANNINLNVNTDTDVTALFKAVDKLDASNEGKEA